MGKTNLNSLDASTTFTILNELGKLVRSIEETRRKIMKVIPAKYGSSLWWEKSDNEALESIRQGRGKKFETYEEAVKYLES